ncbi:MAG: pentapeptide repeat-containing protein, partial [Woeseiaceae bacterium]|nr:pentapeptide repeat-containing protein [Woeseiaceae bacterium]
MESLLAAVYLGNNERVNYFVTTLITIEPILVPLVFLAKIRYQPLAPMLNYLIFIQILMFSYPAFSYNVDEMAQLNSTKICMNCNLNNSNLSGKILINSNLLNSSISNSTLNDAIFRYADLQNVRFVKSELINID